MQSAELAKYVDFFIKNGILRQNEGKLELTHDSLARAVQANLTDRERDLIEARRIVENAQKDHRRTGSLLTEKQLIFLQPLLPDMPLTAEQSELIHNSKSEIKRHKRKAELRRFYTRLAAGGFFVFLIIFLITVILQQRQSLRLRDEAARKQQEAIEAELLAQKSQNEAKRQTQIAQQKDELAIKNIQKAKAALAEAQKQRELAELNQIRANKEEDEANRAKLAAQEAAIQARNAEDKARQGFIANVVLFINNEKNALQRTQVLLNSGEYDELARFADNRLQRVLGVLGEIDANNFTELRAQTENELITPLLNALIEGAYVFAILDKPQESLRTLRTYQMELSQVRKEAQDLFEIDRLQRHVDNPAEYRRRCHRQILQAVPKDLGLYFQQRYYPVMVELRGDTYQQGLPAGAALSFTDGISKSERPLNPEENMSPAHEVKLSRFTLGRSEVTVEQFRLFLMAKQKTLAQEVAAPSWGWDAHNAPMVNVAWYSAGYAANAIEYCNWLSEQFGLEPCYLIRAPMVVDFNPKANGYRLPSEAEWEFAAREGGKLLCFSGGNVIDQVAWYTNNAANRPREASLYSLPVDYPIKPNALGFYHLSGNVAEWCNDWYAADAYTKIANKPRLADEYQSGLNPNKPNENFLTLEKSIRGGSWNDLPSACTVFYRSGMYFAQKNPQTGFRVCRN